MSFIEELRWRGLLHDTTGDVEKILNEGKTITGYIGYDPTADSLTIGNLVTIMLLKHFQLAGHRPIVVLGGATGKIGDPSGKSQERQLLSYAQIESNIERFRAQFGKLLSFEGENAAIMVNNADFYAKMDVFTFLRDIGKNITISYMLSKESVKNRMEKGISFTEFSYQLIQGYDFQYLYENHNCTLQMGGSDQWGNITTGTEFVRKNGGHAHGLTCPLLTDANGKKIGKSEGNNVWLAPDRTSPYQFYQYWLGSGILDADLPKLFKVFSLRSREEIESLLTEHAENPLMLRELLAEEMTVRIHSREAYEAAKKAKTIVFSKKLQKTFLEELSLEEFGMLEQELECVAVPKASLNEGVNIIEFLAGKHRSLSSKGDVRRALKGNAIAVNAEKVSGEDRTISDADLLHGKYLLLQNGKKNKFIAVVE